MLRQINKWFDKYKSYLLFFKDGFWDIPYLSNSPKTIIQSVIKMPFTKHDVKRQSILSSTPLIKGIMYYDEIEDGLYFIHSDMTYKANINYKSVTDDTLSSEWYMLSLTICSLKQKHPC
jgi:hypothetical protein